MGRTTSYGLLRHGVTYGTCREQIIRMTHRREYAKSQEDDFGQPPPKVGKQRQKPKTNRPN